MKTLILRSLALLVLVSPLVARATAPANDLFANARAIGGSIVTLNNQTGLGATADVYDPYITVAAMKTKPTHSVWYRFDGLYNSITKNHISITHTAGANFALFTQGDPDGGAGSLILVAGTEVGNATPGTTDSITFSTVAGQRYYVCVDTASTFSLTLQLPGQDSYLFKDAIALTGNQGSLTGSNLNCLASGDAPATPIAHTPFGGVWYSWTPTVTGTLVLDTNFSYLYGTTIHPTRIAVFTGTSLANLVSVASAPGSGQAGARVAFTNAAAGTTYYVWVGDAFPGGGGALNLEWFQEGNVGTFDLFPPINPSVASGQGLATFQVRRRFAGNVVASVKVSTTNGTAVAGTDFTGITNQVISFPAGGSTGDENPYVQTFTVALLPHATPQPAKGFALNLSGQTATGALGFSITSVSIAADAPAIAPGFQTSSLSVVAGTANFGIPISRANTAGDVVFAINANVQGEDTAVNGNDYHIQSAGMEFAAGQSSAVIPITIDPAAKSHGNKVFTVTIVPELPDLPVDGASTITVTIVDPAPPQPATGRISLELDTGIAADLVLNIASNGTVTGKINMDKANYAITGRFDATGLLTIHFGAATGVGTLTARTLLVQLTDSAAQTYEVTLIDNVLGGQEQGAATATNFNALNPCPFAGAYTCVDNHTLPDSICAFKVDVLGNATVAGKVFDGTVIAATGAVDGAGNLSVGTSLYAGQGRWTLTSVLPTTLLTPATNAFIHLTRPGPANQSVVLPAVDSYTVGALAIYTPPAPGFRMFGPWNTAGTGAAIVTGGGYAAVTTQDLLISMTNVVTLTGGSTIPSLKLTLVPATGLFTGTITPPAIPPAVLPKAVPFCGAIIQGNASAQGGLGFFLNGITEGGVLLQ